MYIQKNVHDYLPNKSEIKEVFNSIKIPMSILSNGPMENVNRILDFYNITHLFKPIIDIKMNNLVGKPNAEVYEKILKEINLPIHEVLFVDDVEDYLIPFHDMGGKVLLVNEKNIPTKMNFDQINNILEIKEYICQ